MRDVRVVLALLLFTGTSPAQQYSISTIAGGAPPQTPAPALSASIGASVGVVADVSRNVYFTGLHCVFRLDVNGVLTRVAGNSRAGFSGDEGPAANAQLNYPWGLAIDTGGNLYIGDSRNGRVRKVSPGGIISTVAGNLGAVTGVAVDTAGNLYVASSTPTDRVRKVSSGGVVTTVAGNGTAAWAGDGGPASNAQLNPLGVAVDPAGNLYIADAVNNRVRKISPEGVITTVAGSGAGGYSGDGGQARNAQLFYPKAVAVDAGGNLLIADSANGRIRKVSLYITQ